jgi:hypothetical protein
VKKINIIVSVLMLILAAYVFMSARAYPKQDLTLGPAFFPELVAGGLVFFSIALLIQTMIDKADNTEVATPRTTFWMAMLAMTAYLAVMPRVGFMISTPVFLFLVGLYMSDGWKAWWKKLAVSSLVTSGIIYYLFAELLHVPLPL